MKILLVPAMLGLWDLFGAKPVHEPALEPKHWISGSSRIDSAAIRDRLISLTVKHWISGSSRIDSGTLMFSFPGNPEPGVSILSGENKVYEGRTRILAAMYYDYEAAGSFEPAECEVRLTTLPFELDKAARLSLGPFPSMIQRELGYEPMPTKGEVSKTVSQIEGRSGSWTKISFAKKADPAEVRADCYYQPISDDSFLSLCASYKFTLRGDPPRLARRRAMLDEIARKIEFQPSPPGEAPPAAP